MSALLRSLPIYIQRTFERLLPGQRLDADLAISPANGFANSYLTPYLYAATHRDGGPHAFAHPTATLPKSHDPSAYPDAEVRSHGDGPTTHPNAAARSHAGPQSLRWRLPPACSPAGPRQLLSVV